MHLGYPLSSYTYERYGDQLMNHLKDTKFEVIKSVTKVYPTRSIVVEVPDDITPQQAFQLGGMMGRFEKMIESHQI